jgi:hypothetical protein
VVWGRQVLTHAGGGGGAYGDKFGSKFVMEFVRFAEIHPHKLALSLLSAGFIDFSKLINEVG